MRSHAHHAESDRRTRLLAATAVSLLVVTLLVEWWPARVPEPPAPPPPPGPEIVVAMEEIVPTQQSGNPPPPPPPDLPPVEVEDEVVLEDVPLEITEVNVPAPPRPGPPSEAPPGDDTTTRQGARSGGVTRAPVPVRMVQPPIRDGNPDAEVRVEVVVDERGRVTEATIRQRFVLRRGTREPVDALDARLEAEALEVARRWMFRPALRDGERVEQTFTLTLGWGR